MMNSSCRIRTAAVAVTNATVRCIFRHPKQPQLRQHCNHRCNDRKQYFQHYRYYQNRSASSGSNRHHNDCVSENDQLPLLSFSEITETPLDSIVMEKPYTLILMEDETSASFHSPHLTPNDVDVDVDADADDGSDSQVLASWSEIFRERVPKEYGMSFASISMRFRRTSIKGASKRPNDSASKRRSRSISDGLKALKSSDLPQIGDAVLVARGPISSLCAQYYLESFSLRGLVMIDPILLDDGLETDDLKEATALVTMLFGGGGTDVDTDSIDRFRLRRLLVEPNSVPMMVVTTAPHKYNKHVSRLVAARHGDPDGPYGRVPILELPDTDGNDETDRSSSSTAYVEKLLGRIDDWIDEAL